MPAGEAKQPLLLLPGMMCDARLFAPQIGCFSASCDIRTGDIGRHDTVERTARALLDEAPWRSFAVCGLSMGGIIAMEMVAQAPERIERLALLDTSHLADAPERRVIRNRQIAEARRGGLRALIVDEMKPNYLATGSQRDAALLDLLVDMAETLGGDAFVRQSKALRDRRPAHAGMLAAYARPVLVLCGEEDRLCPPERHRQIAALFADARLVVVPGAGHISTLERPEAVNDALREWLGLEPSRADAEAGG